MSVGLLAMVFSAGGWSQGVSTSGAVATEATPKPRIGFIVARIGDEPTTLVLGAAIHTAGLPTTYSFEYGSTSHYGFRTPAQSVAGGGPVAEVRTTVEDLTPRKLIHYRIVVQNSAGTIASRDRVVTTGGDAPVFSDSFVRNGAVLTSIVLGATIDTRGLLTAARAECGPGPRIRSADALIPAVPNPRSWAPTRTTVRFSLTGLAPAKHYSCRLLAFNEAGSTARQRDFDSAKAFRGVQYPALETGPRPDATFVTATIDTGGLPTTYHVEYGPSLRYGAATPTRKLRPRPGTGWLPTTTEVRALLRNLDPATTYYYRVIAANATGKRIVARSFVSEGERASLSYSYVAPGPRPVTGVFGISLDTGGLETTYRVEYGTGVDYGSATSNVVVPAFPSPASYRPSVAEIRSDPVDLRSGVTFHYRVVATNAAGTTHSSDRTFTTR